MTETRLPPAEKLNPEGSAASCEVGKLSTRMSPTEKLSPGTKSLTSGSSLAKGMPSKLPLLRYTGAPVARLTGLRPLIWSECSCVMSTADMSEGESSRAASPSETCFPLMPASTRSAVRSVLMRKQFPLLPLAKEQIAKFIFCAYIILSGCEDIVFKLSTVYIDSGFLSSQTSGIITA